MSDLKTYVLNVKGKKPDDKQVEQCLNLKYGKEKAGIEEIKNAFKWFGIGIATSIAAFIFGRWVISSFVGIGVIFFGYGLAYVLTPVMLCFAIYNLLGIFRSARKKKVADAFEWIWLTSILGNELLSGRFGNLNFAVSATKRVFPEGIQFNEIDYINYLNSFRNEILRLVEANAKTFKDAGWYEVAPHVRNKLIKDEKINDHLHEIHAQITFNDVFNRIAGKDTEEAIATKIEIKVVQYYIKSGRYWFPYDFMPEFKLEK